MAVSDEVILNLGYIAAATPVTTAAPDGPMPGVVVNEPGGGLSDIVWKNGIRTNGIVQANLLKLFNPDTVENTLIGKFCQLVLYPSQAVAGANLGSLPKSPGAAGVVRDVFGVSAYDGVAATAHLAVLAVQDGRAVMTVPNPLETLREDAGRRNIGRD